MTSANEKGGYYEEKKNCNNCGDIFQRDKGYERVIGVSEDGSFYLSETIFKNEIKQMRENESGKNEVSLAE